MKKGMLPLIGELCTESTFITKYLLLSRTNALSPLPQTPKLEEKC